ncbi:MAG: PhoH family protein [Leptospiraceae bacterium]|nr:PhoH family protein [Leptospiraceae bacterium]
MLKFSFLNEALYEKVCGINDILVPELEEKLEIDIIPRGTSLMLGGEKKKVQEAIEFFNNLTENFERRPDKQEFDSFDINYLIHKNGQPGSDWRPSEKILTTFRGRHIYPRTRNQEKYITSLLKNMLSFGIGPAGTGKTFLSIATACRLLNEGEVQRIVLTRPAVEAGESLGFLPGDLVQKVDPYLRPVYDALYECIGFEKTQELISVNKIEIAPIAFMRGRTLSNSFIILDEAQNCTMSQLKMFMTRLGRNSVMSVSGDVTQVDLATGKSGLQRVVDAFRDTNKIGVVEFGKEDISRHSLVEVIVKKFESLV